MGLFGAILISDVIGQFVVMLSLTNYKHCYSLHAGLQNSYEASTKIVNILPLQLFT